MLGPSMVFIAPTLVSAVAALGPRFKATSPIKALVSPVIASRLQVAQPQCLTFHQRMNLQINHSYSLPPKNFARRIAYNFFRDIPYAWITTEGFFVLFCFFDDVVAISIIHPSPVCLLFCHSSCFSRIWPTPTALAYQLCLGFYFLGNLG